MALTFAERFALVQFDLKIVLEQHHDILQVFARDARAITPEIQAMVAWVEGQHDVFDSLYQTDAFCDSVETCLVELQKLIYMHVVFAVMRNHYVSVQDYQTLYPSYVETFENVIKRYVSTGQANQSQYERNVMQLVSKLPELITSQKSTTTQPHPRAPALEPTKSLTRDFRDVAEDGLQEAFIQSTHTRLKKIKTRYVRIMDEAISRLEEDEAAIAVPVTISQPDFAQDIPDPNHALMQALQAKPTQLFHRAVSLKLNELIISAKAVAGEMVGARTQGKGYAGKGIMLLGQAIPIVGLAIVGTGAALEAADALLERDRGINISAFAGVSFAEADALVKGVADRLTFTLALQLQHLTAETRERVQNVPLLTAPEHGPIKKQWKKVKRQAKQTGKKLKQGVTGLVTEAAERNLPGYQVAAEYALLNMMYYMGTQLDANSHVKPLDQRIFELYCATFSNAQDPFYKLCNLREVRNKVLHPPIRLETGARWTGAQLFNEIGVKALDQHKTMFQGFRHRQYAQLETAPVCGYRIGSSSEVTQIGLDSNDFREDLAKPLELPAPMPRQSGSSVSEEGAPEAFANPAQAVHNRDLEQQLAHMLQLYEATQKTVEHLTSFTAGLQAQVTHLQGCVAAQAEEIKQLRGGAQHEKTSQSSTHVSTPKLFQ